MAELRVGDTFAGHRIDAIAGRGGMGMVYKATHLALDVVVALKVMAPEYAEDAGFRERFKREARLAASIEHSHVVQVRDAGEEGGLLYITMRYVDGTDLRTMLEQRGRLEPRVAAGIISQVASALDAAHARGLVHRDVKPGNVLLEERGGTINAFLGDFGLTRQALTRGAGLTKTGQWVGTLDYVAPEQIEGKQIDARADIYALGCVFYEALTGSVPYPRDSDVATMYAHLNEPPPKPRETDTSISPELDAVVHRAMAKKPKDRFPSAGDFGRAAVAAVEGRTVEQPEQMVATGKAAAGEQTPVAGETVLSGSPEVTVTSAPVPAGQATAAGQAAPRGGDTHAPAAGVRGWPKWVPRGRVLIAIGAVLAVAAIAVVAVVALGGGGKKRDLPVEARGVMRRFGAAFGSEDLSGIQGVLAPGAQYFYLGNDSVAATKEYKDIFDAIEVGGYKLDVSSVAAKPDGADVSFKYSYDDTSNRTCGHQTGTVEMKMQAQQGGDGPLKINEVNAVPDVYECIDIGGAPDFGTYTLRVGGSGGPVVSKVVKTIGEDGKKIPIRLPLNDTGQTAIRSGDKLTLSNTGHDSGGSYSVTYKPVTPWAS